MTLLTRFRNHFRHSDNTSIKFVIAWFQPKSPIFFLRNGKRSKMIFTLRATRRICPSSNSLATFMFSVPCEKTNIFRISFGGRSVARPNGANIADCRISFIPSEGGTAFVKLRIDLLARVIALKVAIACAFSSIGSLQLSFRPTGLRVCGLLRTTRWLAVMLGLYSSANTYMRAAKALFVGRAR